MVRVKAGTASRNRHKKFIKAAKGYHGIRSKLFKYAKTAVIKAGAKAFADRRVRKRDFRKLWTVRINAGARQLDTTYSKLIAGMNDKSININRKMLADLAMTEPIIFAEIVKTATK